MFRKCWWKHNCHSARVGLYYSHLDPFSRLSNLFPHHSPFQSILFIKINPPKCCVHCTQPSEAPWSPAGWSPDLLARQLSLLQPSFHLLSGPLCNSLFSWYTCGGLLSSLFWTSLDCPLSCYGLWLHLCPSKCYSYSSSSSPADQDLLFPLQHSLPLSYIVFIMAVCLYNLWAALHPTL